MKTILIAGGLGFIGINLILRLLKDEENFIIVVDNQLYGSREKEIKKSKILESGRVKIEYRNICDRSWVEEVCKYEKIDKIYHLAAIASPIWYKQYPQETLDVSYIGTQNLFEIGRKYDAKVLICSSSEVYGDPHISPQHEEYFGNTNPYGERSCYDEGKRIMETLAYTYQKKYQMKIHIIRIFNTYGPYMNIEDGRVIPSFIRSYLNQLPIQIFNNGTQTRAFNYIDDTLNGMEALMNSEVYTPINIGNTCEISIMEFYLRFIEVLQVHFDDYKPFEITYGFSDHDDPKVRKPDLTKARELLKYEIKTTLEEGLRKTIAYFREVHHLSKL